MKLSLDTCISILNKYKQLLNSTCELDKKSKYSVHQRLEPEIQNNIYFIIKGQNFNPIDHLEKIKTNKPKVVVISKADLELSQIKDSYDGDLIVVENTRKAFACICHDYFMRNNTMKYIGVTGTNGKTSTAWLCYQLLLQKKHSAAFIGTIGLHSPQYNKTLNNTSPGSFEFFSFVSELYKKGIRYIITEFSSHAIDQHRYYPIKFDRFAFTSFSQDHLDYHKNMQEYLDVKIAAREYFDDDTKVFINDGFIESTKMTQNDFDNKLKNPYEVYGLSSKSRWKIIEDTNKSYKIKLDQKTIDIPICFQQKFMAENLLAALLLANCLSSDLDKDVSLESLQAAPGRVEEVYNKKFRVIVDSAHTPDALDHLLKSIKKAEGSKLVVLFGCGGDRDKSKRVPMAVVVSRYADEVYVTSDNPRFEEPLAIIEDIKKGFSEEALNKCKFIEDRKLAIKEALTHLDNDDVFVLAGKGHESYLEIKGEKQPYNDKEQVLTTLKEMRVEQ